MMNYLKLEVLATLRAVVGYLGEKEQYGWWPSSFFGPGSSAFLTPVFGRTASLAQLTAVTHGAARLHDEYIGVSNTYHLFRLPEDLEQDIHTYLASLEPNQSLRALTQGRQTALTYLQNTANDLQTSPGPIYVGTVDTLRSAEAWETVAAYYADAFAHSIQSFPYFADRTV